VENPEQLPLLDIEEPTVQMTFSVNTSPFAGKEGEFKTSRQIQERLLKELEKDVALRKLLSKEFLVGIDSNFKQFCRGIRNNLRLDNYEIIAITGYPGTGKSQLAAIMGCLVDEDYSFVRNINFIPIILR
jgi:DNA replication protein DnaC